MRARPIGLDRSAPRKFRSRKQWGGSDRRRRAHRVRSRTPFRSDLKGRAAARHAASSRALRSLAPSSVACGHGSSRKSASSPPVPCGEPSTPSRRATCGPRRPTRRPRPRRGRPPSRRTSPEPGTSKLYQRSSMPPRRFLSVTTRQASVLAADRQGLLADVALALERPEGQLLRPDLAPSPGGPALRSARVRRLDLDLAVGHLDHRDEQGLLRARPRRDPDLDPLADLRVVERVVDLRLRGRPPRRGRPLRGLRRLDGLGGVGGLAGLGGFGASVGLRGLDRLRAPRRASGPRSSGPRGAWPSRAPSGGSAWAGPASAPSAWGPPGLVPVRLLRLGGLLGLGGVGRLRRVHLGEDHLDRLRELRIAAREPVLRRLLDEHVGLDAQVLEVLAVEAVPAHARDAEAAAVGERDVVRADHAARRRARPTTLPSPSCLKPYGNTSASLNERSLIRTTTGLPQSQRAAAPGGARRAAGRR